MTLAGGPDLHDQRVDDGALAQRVAARRAALLDETSGLVRAPVPTPMLQPYEVYDRDLFDLEMIRVFARSWVWVGDSADLREAGDFVTGVVGAQPVIVFRQADGSLRAFLNNCRHRASGLSAEPAGHCGRTITCPYHHWAYAIDGRLVGIPDQHRMYPDGFPVDEYGLVPVRVEEAWGTLVFVCLSRRTESFRDWLGPLAGRYDRYRFERFHRYRRQLDQTYPINWKAFVENSNDDYHVRFVHRRLNDLRHQMDTIVRVSGRTASGYKPHRLEVDDPAGGRDDLDAEQRAGHYADFVYPNLTPLVFPTQLMLVRADPLAPDRTRLVSRVYGLAGTEEEEAAPLEQLATTNREDTDMVTILMANLRSPFTRVGPPTTWEARAAHMMRLVRADVARPLAPDEFTAGLTDGSTYGPDRRPVP